jgi:hypothetical protein
VKTSAFEHYWRKSPGAIRAYRFRKTRVQKHRSERVPADVQRAVELSSEPERHVVPDAPGYWLLPHGEAAGDGRRKFGIYRGECELMAAIWGEDAAESAARELAAKGSLSR